MKVMLRLIFVIFLQILAAGLIYAGLCYGYDLNFTFKGYITTLIIDMILGFAMRH